VWQLQGLICDHFAALRARRHTRAGRLLIAEIFAPIMDKLIADVVTHFVTFLAGDMSYFLFKLLEHGRARLLLDQLTGLIDPPADPAAGLAFEQKERRFLALAPNDSVDESIMAELRLTSRLPMVAVQDARGDPRGAAHYRQQLHDIDALEAEFARTGAKLLYPGRVCTLKEVQADLEPGEAFLTLAIPRETLHPARQICTLFVTADDVKFIYILVDEALKSVPGLDHGDIGSLSIGEREPLESSPLGSLITLARLAIQHDSPLSKSYLRLLYLTLIRPLEEIGVRPADYRHWFICPSGPLHVVPFPALLDAKGQHLIQHVALTMVPSASVWLRLRSDWTEFETFVGFANPALDRTVWPALETEGAPPEEKPAIACTS
jgi:hypothetical protein